MVLQKQFFSMFSAQHALLLKCYNFLEKLIFDSNILAYFKENYAKHFFKLIN